MASVTDPRSTPPSLLLAALVALSFLFGLFPAWDFDLWGHLAAAQRIVETGSITGVDPFLWGVEGRPWIDLYWGFQLIALALFSLGGVSLLVIAKALCAAGAVLLSIVAQPRGTSQALVASVWLAPLVSLSGRCYERPEMASLVLLAAFFAVIAQAAARPRLLWLLPVLELVWVNLHPFFLFGPLVLLLTFLDREGAPPKRMLAAVTGTTLLACLINPYGITGALFPIQVIFGQGQDHLFFKQYIGELRPISFFLERDPSNPYVLAFVATLLIAIAGVLAAVWARRARPSRLILLALFTMLGWSATRNVAFFAWVAATVTIAHLHEALAVWRARREPRSRQQRRRDPGSTARESGRRSIIAAAAGLGALTLLLVTGVFYNWTGEGRELGLGERSNWYAHAAQRFLTQPQMPQRAFVSHFGEANLTLFHSVGRVRVFIDPRLEVASRALFENYLTVLRSMADGDARTWEPLLVRDRQWPSILLDRERSSPQIEGLSRTPGWRAVYADELAVVFLRDEVAQAMHLPPVAL